MRKKIPMVNENLTKIRAYTLMLDELLCVAVLRQFIRPDVGMCAVSDDACSVVNNQQICDSVLCIIWCYYYIYIYIYIYEHTMTMP